jgi:NADH dehydrogenase/NADH:ubiquinone oxidoreductase subunit G
MCDEGRYGFGRFLPKNRVVEAYANTASGEKRPVSLTDVVSGLKNTLKTLTVLVSPDLTLEECYLLKQLLHRTSSVGRVVMPSYKRTLTKVQEILVSPDYASNLAGAKAVGLVGEDSEGDYRDVLGKIRRKEIENILVLGDRAIALSDIDDALLEGLAAARVSVGVLTDADSKIASVIGAVAPGRSILEKSGLLVNGKRRVQYTQAVVQFPDGSVPDWRFLALVGEGAGAKVLSVNPSVVGDREVTRWYLGADPLVSSMGLTIAQIKDGGVQLPAVSREARVDSQSVESAGASPAA